MNTKRFLEKLIHNWPVKIICFVVAILIYFLHQVSILDKKTFSIPVSIISEGTMVPTGREYRNVRVMVRGKSDEIATIQDSEFSAYMDISYLTKEGTYNVPVMLRTNQRITCLEPLEIKISPEKFSINVQEKKIKFVNVEPLIAGEPARGYKVASVKAEPGVVGIEGPRTIVDSISRISTESILIEGIKKNSEHETRLIDTNKTITVQYPDELKVYVNLEEIVTEKDFEKLPVKFVNVSETLDFILPTEFAAVSLQGTLLNLDKLRNSQITVVADCAKITEAGEYSVPVYIRVPSSMTILDSFPKEVKVTARDKPVEETPEEETVPEEETESITAEEAEPSL